MALAQSRRSESTPAVETPAIAPVAENASSNSDVIAMVAGAEVAGPEASALLATDAAGEVVSDPAWARDVDELDEGTTEEVAPKAVVVPEPAKAPVRPTGKTGAVWDDNVRDVARMNTTMSRTQKAELDVFRKKYEANRDRYDEVSKATGIPPLLVAAIHYRESSMNFGTYLHQGDPLGKKAVHVPRDIPVFDDWTEAAIHALNLKKSTRDAVGLTADSRDGAAMATYAETYNGLGYHNRGLASPYVFAGSDRYHGGRYVADGRFDPKSFDRRLGVMTLVKEMGGLDAAANGTSGPAPAANREAPREPWEKVMAGDRVLRKGARGAEVTALQERLAALGYAVDVDGAMGPKTQAAVRRFQQDRGLDPDGAVGAGTAAALEKGGGATVAPEKSAKEKAWAAVAGGQVLERGSRGPAVEALQERLRARGYGVAVDGVFGPATRAAIYDLQAQLGLAVDGGVGPKTAEALDLALGR